MLSFDGSVQVWGLIFHRWWSDLEICRLSNLDYFSWLTRRAPFSHAKMFLPFYLNLERFLIGNNVIAGAIKHQLSCRWQINPENILTFCLYSTSRTCLLASILWGCSIQHFQTWETNFRLPFHVSIRKNNSMTLWKHDNNFHCLPFQEDLRCARWLRKVEVQFDSDMILTFRVQPWCFVSRCWNYRKCPVKRL